MGLDGSLSRPYGAPLWVRWTRCVDEEELEGCGTTGHYNWHRYYDPSIGRYISADPLGQFDGPNVYTYVDNDPSNYIDLDGLAKGKNKKGKNRRFENRNKRKGSESPQPGLNRERSVKHPSGEEHSRVAKGKGGRGPKGGGRVGAVLAALSLLANADDASAEEVEAAISDLVTPLPLGLATDAALAFGDFFIPDQPAGDQCEATGSPGGDDTAGQFLGGLGALNR